MTGLSLRNPIAVLMICIALVVFASVVTPRMSVDTFPELTPPVLIIGTLVVTEGRALLAEDDQVSAKLEADPAVTAAAPAAAKDQRP